MEYENEKIRIGFPRSARSGFLKYQFDLPWYYIKSLNRIGAVTSFNDHKEQFYKKYFEPFHSKHHVSNTTEQYNYDVS